MGRVLLNEVERDPSGLVVPGVQVYVLETNGSLERANDVGSDPAAIEAFLADETLATGFTTEFGGTQIGNDPLITGNEGTPIQDAWFPTGEYDRYRVGDREKPLERWRAINANDLLDVGAVLLGSDSIDETVTQTGAGNKDVLSTTVTVGNRPISIVFSCDGLSNSASGGSAQARIMEGATVLGGFTHTGSGARAGTREVEPDPQPSPGPHTYKVNLIQLITGNASIIAGEFDLATLKVIQL